MRNIWVLPAILIMALSPLGASSPSNHQSARPTIQGFLQRHESPISSRLGGSKVLRRSAQRFTANLANQATPTTSNFGFFSASQLVAGGGAYSEVVSGDFDGDHKQDLAVAVFTDYGSQSAFYLAVLLGNGDGSFQPAVLTPISANFQDPLLVSDLNGDGKDDLIFVHYGYLEVFLSLGSGNFSGPVSYPDGIDNPGAVALFDVNNDGKLDVLIADQIRSSLATLISNGDGTFQGVTLQPAPGPFRNAALADVNGDGRIDLITNSEVFLGTANGFASGTPLINPDGWYGTCDWVEGAVSVADLNGDHYPDIVISDCWRNSVDIFLNNGDGTFVFGGTSWTGIYPEAVSIADVNSDGNPDLIVTNTYSSDFSVALGNGNGTFLSPQFGNASGGHVGTRPVVADFDGDGNNDVVLSVWVGDLDFAMTYFKGYGDGTFAAARDFYSPGSNESGFSYGFSVATADLDADGTPDVVLGNLGPSGTGITVFLANSDGTLKPGVNYGSGGNLTSVATADFNGDGRLDVVAADAATGQMVLFLGNGDGTLQSPQMFGQSSSIMGTSPIAHGVVVGDFNADGRPDVAVLRVQPPRVAVLLQDNAGGFVESASYALNGEGWEIAIGDINSDGFPDLVIPQANSNAVSILLGRGDGSFQVLADVPLGRALPVGAALADLNGDGKTDLIVTVDDWQNGEGIAIALGYGDGTFGTPVFYPSSTQSSIAIQPNPSEVMVLDLNRDGNLDLIYTNSGHGEIGVLFGFGDGTFSTPVEFAVGGFPYGLALSDFNADGAVDVVASNNEFSGVTMLFNTSGDLVSLVSSNNPATYGTPLVLSASVSSTVKGVGTAPTGTLTFWDGKTAIGTAQLVAGTGSIVIPNLSAGTHTLQASYSGDTSFLPGTSKDLSQVVNQGVPSDYTLSANPSSATIHAGQSTVFNITAAPLGGFIGTVNFSCGPLPAGVICQFAPASVTLDGITAQTVQLTVSVAPNVVAANDIPDRYRRAPFWPGLNTIAFGFLLLPGLATPKRRWFFAVAMVLILGMLFMLAGCGSGASLNPNLQTTPQIVQVNAVGAGLGSNVAVNRQLTLDVVIQR